MTNQSIIKLIKWQKIKVDITKETAGYYKTFIIIIIINHCMWKPGHISDICTYQWHTNVPNLNNSLLSYK